MHSDGSKKASDPLFGREAISKTSDSKTTPIQCQTRNHATNAEIQIQGMDMAVRRNAFSTPCIYCDGSHSMDRCQILLQKPFYDITEILKNKGCCYGSLRIGHQRKLCKNKATCSYCKGRHPTILHVDGRIPPRSSQQSSHKSHYCQNQCLVWGWGPEGGMAIIPVKVRLRGSCRLVETYAFMDPGSNISFCSDHLM